MSPPLSIGAAQRPLRGEKVCGDAFSIIETDAHTTLVALADGSGHGVEAARAASLFCDTVRAHGTEPLASIMRAAHRELRCTAGAAGALLVISRSAGSLEFVGVGNISLRSAGCAGDASSGLVSLPGMLGHRMHRAHVFRTGYRKGDLYALFTDGVSSRFPLSEFAAQPVQAIADAIVREYGKRHDDATCLAIRWQE